MEGGVQLSAMPLPINVQHMLEQMQKEPQVPHYPVGSHNRPIRSFW